MISNKEATDHATQSTYMLTTADNKERFQRERQQEDFVVPRTNIGR